VNRSDIAEILYTTGTTGSPKGVVLSHHNVISAISNITKFIGYTNKDHEVITLPLTHSFGLNHVLCNIAAGGSVHIENGLLRLKKVFTALKDNKSTGFPGTPSSFSIILGRYSKNFIEATESLKFIVINSAPLPPTQAKEILKLIPHVKLLVYYGMTEASRATFIKHSLRNEKLLYSVGKASPNVKISIIDDKNRFLSSDRVGEVVIKAETVMKGYWKNYEETKKIMLDGGWLKTGDLGYLNKNKYLFLVGRIKELINIGGLKVSPIEIEDMYKNCDLIDEFIVVGKADKTGISGEKIIGFVKFCEKKTMSENELIQFAQGKIENYKIPSEFHIVSEIPKSETGKLLREQLIKLVGVD